MVLDLTPMCEIVAAEYDTVNEVERLVRDVARPARCHVWIYSKSGSCRQIERTKWVAAASASVSCSELPNRGREQHTFAHHILRHWNMLPARVHLVALPLSSHNRLSILKHGLLNPQLDKSLAPPNLAAYVLSPQRGRELFISDGVRAAAEAVGTETRLNSEREEYEAVDRASFRLLCLRLHQYLDVAHVLSAPFPGSELGVYAPRMPVLLADWPTG